MDTKKQETFVKFPSLFSLKWSNSYKNNLLLVNSKVESLRNRQTEQHAFQMSQQSQKPVQQIVMKGEAKTFQEKCTHLYDISLKRARWYMRMYIFLIILSGFLGAAGGIMVGFLNLIVGLSACGLSSILNALVLMLRLGPLTETFSSVAVQAAHLSHTMDENEVDRAKYELLQTQFETAVLSVEILTF